MLANQWLLYGNYKKYGTMTERISGFNLDLIIHLGYFPVSKLESQSFITS